MSIIYGAERSDVNECRHRRWKCRYKRICKEYDYKAKVFTQVPSDFKSKIGSPDLVVLFTSTVSHSMVRCAIKEAQRKNVEVVRSHTSSSNALKNILAARTEEAV